MSVSAESFHVIFVKIRFAVQRRPPPPPPPRLPPPPPRLPPPPDERLDEPRLLELRALEPLLLDPPNALRELPELDPREALEPAPELPREALEPAELERALLAADRSVPPAEPNEEEREPEEAPPPLPE
jgi:hypothetical protein